MHQVLTSLKYSGQSSADIFNAFCLPLLFAFVGFLRCFLLEEGPASTLFASIPEFPSLSRSSTCIIFRFGILRIEIYGQMDRKFLIGTAALRWWSVLKIQNMEVEVEVSNRRTRFARGRDSRRVDFDFTCQGIPLHHPNDHHHAQTCIPGEGDEMAEEIPENELNTIFDPTTCVKKGLCPVTKIRGQDQDPLESHSLYYELHGTGPEKLLLIYGWGLCLK